ncbi:NADP-dependent aldehyde dehydrogenase [Haloactinopolyspora alba]|uniref:NADP-dependent aldehyde dehydrogenase n=1 Tax=Haloactinopolyspora alba TaxID=648780 RepID=A0A2P8E6W8_9ACTN|nr:aldehyde dehydrogenase (NADP(+)) [Haloactinopolyspora alba]PSL05206.1 NADP-dependent aldehyde dehydrogenase [Haloactinopolyspora alba]
MTVAHETITLTGNLIIGAQDVRGTDGEIAAVDPRTGQALEPSYGLGGAADVERATTLAAEAFATYRQTDPDVRAGFLERIAERIDGLGEQLTERVQAETGLPRARAESERARTTNQLRLFASVLREGSWRGARVDPGQPEREPVPRPDVRQRAVALGPVAVFGASNFPLAFAVAGGDTASALAAGCPVVVKAHEAHPGTSELVARAIQAAVRDSELPAGTFSLLFGSGPGLGTALVTDPRIKAVGFTGSRSAGLALTAAAAGRAEPIPVYAEMSSVNPVFILPDALRQRPEELGAAYIASVTTGAGQLCTSPGLVFVQDGEGADEFLAAAAEATGHTAAAPMLTSGIREAYDRGADALASRESVQRVAVGSAADDIACAGQARLFATTGDAFLAEPELHGEVFGATSLVVLVRDRAQLERVVDALEGQLTATIHATTADHDLAGGLLPALELKAGRVLFNGWPTGVEVGHAMVHGGPFPATSAPRTTSVGTRAIERFLRPVAYQNVPGELLPDELRDGNPLGLWRRVDGELGRH